MYYIRPIHVAFCNHGIMQFLKIRMLTVLTSNPFLLAQTFLGLLFAGLCVSLDAGFFFALLCLDVRVLFLVISVLSVIRIPF